MITSILDPAEATAENLAHCYHDRWEAETGIDQLKTHLRGPGRILRSRTPDLVRQEIWAYLLTHWALATLICVAATTAGVGRPRPDQVPGHPAHRAPLGHRPGGPSACAPRHPLDAHRPPGRPASQSQSLPQTPQLPPSRQTHPTKQLQRTPPLRQGHPARRTAHRRALAAATSNQSMIVN
ncbi:hypothetical protein [Nonomuraea sp. NPDC049141]|uniref:hypothetical protein n=1 Tax=Nonomuraea sp. NPDC049141 TaxID=3155500 RepID=UPI0033ED6682